MSSPRSAAAPVLPAEAASDGWAAGLLAVMMFLAPALGVPSELMLQDTFKSAIVALCTLTAALLFVLAQWENAAPVRWHAVVALPLLLAAYALGSMLWSHPYLGGVEAVRWSVFALIVWLALNTLTRERLPLLAGGIFAGAVAASAWMAVQFWTGLSPFPQSAPPSSTFINRNFFAEFAVCAFPFGVLLLARARRSSVTALLAAAIGLVLVALLMAGTRAALVALWLQLLVILPLIAWRCRRQLAWSRWNHGQRALAAGVLLLTVLVLGLIPSGNPKIIADGHGAAPLLRAFQRTQSIAPTDPSLGLRLVMWRDTLRAIADRPLAGLGAGAWESEIPLYQQDSAQLETDYYVHNEFLQVVAEYGLVGWAFVLLLFAYLLHAFWRSWRDASVQADAERPWRAVLLCSLLALLLVSNFGFAWRLASTGALFALCLGALAASDARLELAGRWHVRPLAWTPALARAALAASAGGLVLALFVTQRAAQSESRLVTATQIARAITASGEPNHPRLREDKRRMLRLLEEGIALHPHYRKITPIVADEMARWGDWRNATVVWESVLASRPYIVAIITNAARGYSSMGDHQKAFAYLERARRLKPGAPAVRSLEVVLLARAGQPELALQRAREALDANVVDQDLMNSCYVLALQAGDHALAMQVLERRMREWPETRAAGYVQLGLLHADHLNDPARALALFRQGLASAAPHERPELLQSVPPAFRAQLAAP